MPSFMSSISKDTSNKKESSIRSLDLYLENSNKSYIGNVRILKYIKDYPFLSIGPDFKFSIIFILFLILSQFTISYYTYNLKIYYFSLDLFLFLIILSLYIVILLKNPGLLYSKYSHTPENEEKFKKDNPNIDILICKTCKVFVSEEIQINHCVKCNTCILGYHHHCGWSSKCIGEGNLFIFRIFVFVGLFKIIYDFYILISAFHVFGT